MARSFGRVILFHIYIYIVPFANNTYPEKIILIQKMRKGEGGIRTLDSFRNYAGFQDRSHKPLGHLSHKYVFIFQVR